MTDQQEPEIHATASLSPVSPSPVHSAAILVVPALQDTADTIEAMVAAVTDVSGALLESSLDPSDDTVQDDFVDDESFDDAYAQDTDPQLPTQADLAPHDTSDDYARMFDSPIGSDDHETQDASVDVSSAAQDSTISHLQPVQEQNSASSASISASGNPSSHSTPGAPGAPAPQPAAQTPAGHDANVPPIEAVKPTEALPADAHSDVQLPSEVEPVAHLNSHIDEAHVIASPAAAQTDIQSGPASGNASPSLASSSSLPPRPPISQAAAQSYSQLSAQELHHAPLHPTASSLASSTETVSSLPPLPQAAGHENSTVPNATNNSSRDEFQRLWDQFMADERQYMSEAKWDRFPEGSRLFIGNLSSDKVSKRDVFEIFRRYGRLAQISLKSAYGFVQYHTIEEGTRAVQNLEGMEIKGRRIHLEVSKLQDKSKKERNKSPDRGGRGRDGPRKGDKYQTKDDQRGGRNHSPRRHGHHGRDESYGREKFYDSGRSRDRSRSPGYGRQDKGSYRRRSNSPYARSRQQEPELDLPRRYGAEVPDIQIILQQEVNRDFVGWVEHAFKEKGLRPEVMFLNPRFPKEQVIQRQAAEGVHAVVELNIRAQNLGKIPVQVFDRSGGSSNVRFDQYVDLEPSVAGEVILRAKAAGAIAAAGASAYPQQSYGGYQQQQYHPPQQQQPPPRGFYGAAAPATHTAPYAQPSVAAPAPTAPNLADIVKLVGQVDNATLQQLLSAMAATTPAPTAAAPPPHAANAQQVDIHALLGALGGNPAGQAAAPAAAHFNGAYGGQPPQGPAPPSSGAPNPESAAQVQNIMAHLARYR